MAYKTFVQRTIWTSKCPKCGGDKTFTENPPKERFCNDCRIWIPYKEESYLGPELNQK